MKAGLTKLQMKARAIMKPYDEIKKIYADMGAKSKTSEKIKTLLNGKRTEQAQREQIYGYKKVGGNQLKVDEIPAENVKFIFRRLLEYIQNPPDELIVRLMEKSKQKGIEDLTYGKAKPLVSLADIQKYVAEELSIKNMAFVISDSPQSAETLCRILNRSFNDFPVDDIRRAYRNKIHLEDNNSTCNWLKRVRRISRNPIYTGTLILKRRSFPLSVRKQCELERMELSNHHTALISKEQFEQVIKSIKEAKYQE